MISNNELVVINTSTGVPTTTSLKVAEVFEREHRDILRAISNLECSNEFVVRNFAQNQRLDRFNRSHPYYEITKDGFTFLAMGFTGAKAAQFKEQYIAAFNEMERRLSHPVQPKELSRLELLTMALEAEQKLIEQKPMVESFHHYMDSGKGMSLRDAANKFGLMPNKFNELLRSQDYLTAKNEPTFKSRKQGYFKSIITTNRTNNFTTQQTLILPDGIEWIANRDRQGDFNSIKANTSYYYMESV